MPVGASSAAARSSARLSDALRKLPAIPRICSSAIAILRACQKRVDRRIDLCPVADRRGDALDRLRAYVTDREQALTGALQRQTGGRGRVPCDDEAARVERDAGARQPVGVRLGADEQ